MEKGRSAQDGYGRTALAVAEAAALAVAARSTVAAVMGVRPVGCPEFWARQCVQEASDCVETRYPGCPEFWARQCVQEASDCVETRYPLREYLPMGRRAIRSGTMNHDGMIWDEEQKSSRQFGCQKFCVRTLYEGWGWGCMLVERGLSTLL